LEGDRYLMRRLLLCLLIALTLCCVYPDEISDKESELSKVESQKNELNRKAREAEEQRRAAEQTKQQKQRQHNMQSRRLEEIIATNNNLSRSLDHSRNLLRQTEENLTALQYSCNETMLHLLLTDQLQTKLNQYENDAHLLSLIMQRLIIENRKLNIQRITITAEKDNKEAEFNKSQTLTSTERNRLNTISSDITNIDREIGNLERQKAIYQAQANELEKTAKALQDLVNMLKLEAVKIEYSYAFAGVTVPPVVGRVVTPFGPKRHERYNIATFSNGVDIAIPENTLIRAMADGTVVYADWFTGSGRIIIIDHKNGYHSVYSYINNLLVRVGDEVRTGQTIAESGKGPNTNEPSLHFEIRRNGVPINPSEIIKVY